MWDAVRFAVAFWGATATGRIRRDTRHIRMRKVLAMDGDHERPHILVVNDSQAILDLLRDLLSDEGYRVSVAIEPLDLTRIKALAPDLIVQDLLFADGSQQTGWHFLTLVRLDPETAHIPMILCTAAMDPIKDPDMAENLNRLGVRVLLKPFNLDDLLAAITEVFASQKLLDQVRDKEPSDEA
jgi:CheY-like chemotaxis protein